MVSVQPSWTAKTKRKSKAVLIQKSSYCWVYSSQKIQLCSFQLSWKIPFVLQHSNRKYWMLSVQPNWKTKTKHKSNNCSNSKEQLPHLSILKWKHSTLLIPTFLENSFFSYNTVIVYTGCYQCSIPEPLKQNTNHKTAPIQKNSFYYWVYSSKKIQLRLFQLSWKIPFVLQHSNRIYWMLSVQPPWTTKTKHKSKNCSN